MSRLNWNRLVAFVAGTFLGGFVLNAVGRVTGGLGKR